VKLAHNGKSVSKSFSLHTMHVRIGSISSLAAVKNITNDVEEMDLSRLRRVGRQLYGHRRGLRQLVSTDTANGRVWH
jgi:hypothetical protein